MTTARDHISDWLENWLRELTSAPRLAAYDLKRHILSAPDSVRQELAALLNPWRPIETAPKNGTQILLNSGGHVWIGAWEDGDWWYRSQLSSDPTSDWLPLPAPPSEDKA